MTLGERRREESHGCCCKAQSEFLIHDNTNSYTPQHVTCNKWPVGKIALVAATFLQERNGITVLSTGKGKCLCLGFLPFHLESLALGVHRLYIHYTPTYCLSFARFTCTQKGCGYIGSHVIMTLSVITHSGYTRCMIADPRTVRLGLASPHSVRVRYMFHVALLAKPCRLTHAIESLPS